MVLKQEVFVLQCLRCCYSAEPKRFFQLSLAQLTVSRLSRCYLSRTDVTQPSAWQCAGLLWIMWSSKIVVQKKVSVWSFSLCEREGFMLQHRPAIALYFIQNEEEGHGISLQPNHIHYTLYVILIFSDVIKWMLSCEHVHFSMLCTEMHSSKYLASCEPYVITNTSGNKLSAWRRKITWI